MKADRWPSTHPSVLANAGLGKAAAWQRLHSDYYDHIVKYAVTRGLPKPDAEDVAQDVFQHLFLQLSKQRFSYDRNKGRFRGWLARVIRQRAWRFRQAQINDSAVRFDTVTMAEMVEGKPQDHSIDHRLDVAIVQLKKELRTDEWEVFDLYWNHGLKPRSIAATTGKTSPQVSKIIFKSRQRLLALMNDSQSDSG